MAVNSITYFIDEESSDDKKVRLLFSNTDESLTFKLFLYDIFEEQRMGYSNLLKCINNSKECYLGNLRKPIISGIKNSSKYYVKIYFDSFYGNVSILLKEQNIISEFCDVLDEVLDKVEKIKYDNYSHKIKKMKQN